MMDRAVKPSSLPTAEELKRLAAAAFEEAATLPNGPQRDKLLNSAYSFRSAAETKGWLSSELRSPK
jgi:hypothetical protein